MTRVRQALAMVVKEGGSEDVEKHDWKGRQGPVNEGLQRACRRFHILSWS